MSTYLVLGRDFTDQKDMWKKSQPITKAQPELAVKEAGMEGYDEIVVYTLSEYGELTEVVEVM